MPTPNQIAKSGTEHGEQAALFAWANMAAMRGFAAANDDQCYTVAGYAEATYGTQSAIPALHWYHAIPNGGSRGDDAKTRQIRGGALKAEGVKQGVFDTFWPYTNTFFAGLYIEMKKPSLRPKRGGSGGVSDEQQAFGDYANGQNYCVRVAWSWAEAAAIVQAYYNGTI